MSERARVSERGGGIHAVRETQRQKSVQRCYRSERAREGTKKRDIAHIKCRALSMFFGEQTSLLCWSAITKLRAALMENLGLRGRKKGNKHRNHRSRVATTVKAVTHRKKRRKFIVI